MAFRRSHSGSIAAGTYHRLPRTPSTTSIAQGSSRYRWWYLLGILSLASCLLLHLMLTAGRSDAALAGGPGAKLRAGPGGTAPHRSFLQQLPAAATLPLLQRLQPDAMHPGMRIIPKVIHMTWERSTRLPADLAANVESWRAHNPGWEVRIYNDSAAARYAYKHFPQYERAYRGLGKMAEKAHFFRYLVLLQEGGVVVDIDVQCTRPIDDYIPAMGAGLVVGWERDGVPPSKCRELRYARQRQLAPWAMAAVSGHPALKGLADRIAASWNTTTHWNSERNTAERTGGAALTDTVMNYTRRLSGSRGYTAWPVTFLPRAVWGHSDSSAEEAPMRAVVHAPKAAAAFHAGAATTEPWASSSSSSTAFSSSTGTGAGASSSSSGSSLSGQKDVVEFGGCAPLPPRSLWPVTVPWSTSFTTWVNLPWEGASDSGFNPSESISSFGSFQPGLRPVDQPSPLDVLDLLMTHASHANKKGVTGAFMDLGPGYGLYSLAMASRNHKVVSFAKVGDKAMAAFNHSIYYNGLEGFITVLPVQLAQALYVMKAGAADPLMQQAVGIAAARDAAAAVLTAGAGARRSLLQHSESGGGTLHQSAAGGESLTADIAGAWRSVLQARAAGGGSSAADAISSALAAAAGDLDLMPQAWLMTQRNTLDSLFGALRSLRGMPVVDVVRVGANGWEPLLLDSLLTMLGTPPKAIMITWDTAYMGQDSGGATPSHLLRRLSSQGYTRALVAGRGCCKDTSRGSMASVVAAQLAKTLGPTLATVSWCDATQAVVKEMMQAPMSDMVDPPPPKQVVFMHSSFELSQDARNTKPLADCKQMLMQREKATQDSRPSATTAARASEQHGVGKAGSVAAGAMAAEELPIYRQPKVEMGSLIKGTAA